MSLQFVDVKLWEYTQAVKMSVNPIRDFFEPSSDPGENRYKDRRTSVILH
jgi:hypothetical protein